MAVAAQRLKIVSFHGQGKKAKGVLIDKRSIGTATINGKTYTYNADLVYHEYKSVEEVVEDAEKKKPTNKTRTIVIRRK